MKSFSSQLTVLASAILSLSYSHFAWSEQEVFARHKPKTDQQVMTLPLATLQDVSQQFNALQTKTTANKSAKANTTRIQQEKALAKQAIDLKQGLQQALVEQQRRLQQVAVHIQQQQLPVVIQQRQQDIEKQLLARHQQLLGLLDNLEQSEQQQKADQRQKAFQQLQTTLANWQGNLHPTLINKKSVPKLRQPIKNKTEYLKNVSLLGVEPLQVAGPLPADMVWPVLPQLPMAPQSEDTAANEDVQLTPAIYAKAAELNHNPAQIYKWVYDNIKYIPSYGSIQGAEQTLLSKQGNAFDTSSLLIALLRASNIPARYVYGTVDIPKDKAIAWLGSRNIEQVVTAFTQGGVPNTLIDNAGQTATLQIEHVWVEAYVDYVPSRGVVNKVPDTWIPLDASYKRQESKEGIAGSQLVSLDSQALLNGIKQGATFSEQNCQVQGLQSSGIETALTQVQQAIGQYVSQHPDTTSGDLLGSQQISAYPSRSLSSALPYKVTVAAADFQTLPNTMRHYLTVKLYQNDQEKLQDNPAVNVKISMPRLANQQLSVGFVPSTADDKLVLDSYLPSKTAANAVYTWQELPTELPSYLIKMTPVLMLGHQELKRGEALTFGQSVDLQLGIERPINASLAPVLETITVGDYHSVVVNGQGFNSAILNNYQQTLSNYQQNNTLTTGDVLAAAAYAYWTINDTEEAIAAKLQQLSGWRSPSISRASSTWQSELSYGLPLLSKPEGLRLAVDQLSRQLVNPINQTIDKDFVRSQRIRELWLQGQVLKQLFDQNNQAQFDNALTQLKQAQQAGQRTTQLTANNYAALVGQFNSLSTQSQTALQLAVTGDNNVLLSSADNDQSVLWLSGERQTSRYVGIETQNTRFKQHTVLRPQTYGWLSQLAATQTQSVVVPVLAELSKQSQAINELSQQQGGVRLAQNAAQQQYLATRLLLQQLPVTAECQQATAIMAQLAVLQNSQLATPSTNRRPVISSLPLYQQAANSDYRYQLLATDADNDPLSYRLLQAPTGMSISPQGLISWRSGLSGTYVVSVRVDDGQAYQDQTWTISVGAAADPLEIGVMIQPSLVNAGEPVQISVYGQGGAGIISRELRIDGQLVTLDSSGNAQVTASNQVGNHEIVATISDGKQTQQYRTVYTVKDSADTDEPTAIITSPQTDSEITQRIVIQGTADDQQLAEYRVVIKPAGAPDSSWQVINKGYSKVINGELGRLDPTTKANGLYDLALIVKDSQGREVTQSISIELGKDLKLGQFALSFSDLNYDIGGLPLSLIRSYDTRRKDEKLSFGYGWSESSQSVTVRKNMQLGLNWQVVTKGLQLCLQPTGKRKLTISLPDGQIERFEAKAETPCTIGLPPPNIIFTPTNSTSRLEVVNASTPFIQGGMLYDLDNNEVWNPQQYKLTRSDGTVFYLKEGLGIEKVTDRYGNSLTFTANGINSSNGQTLRLVRDNQSRISQAIDIDGKTINYSYDAQGDLISVTDRLGKKTTFDYDNHHALISYTDSRGIKIAAMNYDEQGRLISMGDSSGQAVQLNHDLDNHLETITDRRGYKTVYRYDDAGNVLEMTDALGHKTQYSYDANGNELTVTDALGHTTTKSYGTSLTGSELGSYNQVLTETNALGHTTTYSYENPSGELKTTTDAKGNTTTMNHSNFGLSISEPLGRVSAMGLDNKGNLTQLNVAGNVTSYRYNSQGKVEAETSPTGVVTNFSYDAQGNEIERRFNRTDNGKTLTISTKKTYDANGNVLSDSNALGQTRTYVYNAVNKVIKETDEQGRSTEYDYDKELRLVKTRYFDGTSDSKTYDANGNVTAETDRLGRVTRMEYDALNRVIKTINPDGTSSSTEYDAVGRVIATVDTQGRRQQTQYDAIGRVVLVKNALGEENRYEYDANGNRTAVINAQNQRTEFVYDALNRLIKTQHADGSFSQTELRNDGLKAAEIDETGRRVDYRYDNAGRLIEVITTDGQTP